MKKTSMFIAVLVMTFFLISIIGFGTAFAQKKPIVLRLVVPAPEGDFPLTYKDKELVKRFNERAKGEYVMEVHAGGALAKIPEYFDAVRIGAVEMADVDWSIYSFLDPRFSAIATPFLVDSLEGGIAMSKRLMPLHDEIFQGKFNAKALGMFSVDGIELVSTKPVRTLEDWKGLLAGAGAPITAALFKELGASPVTIMWTDLFEALQKHIIDATAQTAHGALAMGLMDVCTHITLFCGHGAWNGYTINLDVWKKMPKNIQKLLQEEIDQSVQWMEGTMIKLRDEDMKAFKQKGTKIIVVPKAERDRWAKQLASFKEKQIASFGDLGQKIKKIADEANKQYPYTERVIK
jgi:TRAP-type C4-dicarboxylate transport system substrate-binding protein